MLHVGARLRHPCSTLLSCPPALQNKPNTNGAQFFVTLDRADHCNRQYTIFGKITGAQEEGWDSWSD